jgi:hypothetical protein
MSDPSSAHKPKYLTAAQKRNVEMGPGGWVRKPGDETGSSGGDPEILVAFRGSGSVTGWISSFRWGSDTVTSSTGTLTVNVYFSENVDITGTPQLLVNSTGTNTTLDYASGTGTDVIVFSKTGISGNLSATDILNINANAISLNGGTIKDAGTSTVTTITNAANQGNTGNPVTGGNRAAATDTAETDGPRIKVILP